MHPRVYRTIIHATLAYMSFECCVCTGPEALFGYSWVPCVNFAHCLLYYVFQEVQRIRDEHRDDAFAVVNDRVKGSLKVTRAFGAGFLKQVITFRDHYLR